MYDYQIELKQIVQFPRCRMYRQFIQTLIEDQSIRASGGSGLFYFTVLCSYANFRTSYRRIGGVDYTVYPGEWVCGLAEMQGWFRMRSRRQTLDMLEDLQARRLITYNILGHEKVVRFKIIDWDKHNTVLDYNAPCFKDKRAVEAGTVVEQGDVIGYVGTTGVSSGNHLHLEVAENGDLKQPRDYLP